MPCCYDSQAMRVEGKYELFARNKKNSETRLGRRWKYAFVRSQTIHYRPALDIGSVKTISRKRETTYFYHSRATSAHQFLHLCYHNNSWYFKLIHNQESIPLPNVDWDTPPGVWVAGFHLKEQFRRESCAPSGCHSYKKQEHLNLTGLAEEEMR